MISIRLCLKCPSVMMRISHYETNKNSFVTEDSVALEYVLLSADNFQEQVVITDEDIRAAYEAEVASATSDLERRARHILISKR